MFSELIKPLRVFAFVPLWVQTQSGYERCIFPTLLPSSLLPFVLFTKQRHFSHPASPPLLAAALLSAPFPPHHRDPFPHYCPSPSNAAFPPPSPAGPALGSHGPLELRGHSQAFFFFLLVGKSWSIWSPTDSRQNDKEGTIIMLSLSTTVFSSRGTYTSPGKAPWNLHANMLNCCFSHLYKIKDFLS